MRVVVFFDLPTLTASNRREYTKFRKHLIKSGFIMMQESVYCKLALNTTTVQAIISNLEKSKPEQGLVQILAITEKQFSKMLLLVGEIERETIDSDERLVVL